MTKDLYISQIVDQINNNGHYIFEIKTIATTLNKTYIIISYIQSNNQTALRSKTKHHKAQSLQRNNIVNLLVKTLKWITNKKTRVKLLNQTNYPTNTGLLAKVINYKYLKTKESLIFTINKIAQKLERLIKINQRINQTKNKKIEITRSTWLIMRGIIETNKKIKEQTIKNQKNERPSIKNQQKNINANKKKIESLKKWKPIKQNQKKQEQEVIKVKSLLEDNWLIKTLAKTNKIKLKKELKQQSIINLIITKLSNEKIKTKNLQGFRIKLKGQINLTKITRTQTKTIVYKKQKEPNLEKTIKSILLTKIGTSSLQIKLK